jgi:hypothetical protein
MERLVVILHLKNGAQRKAAELIAQGAPFDLSESGLERHGVYISPEEVAFVFEGHEVEWLVDALVFDPYQLLMSQAIDEWRELVDEHPRIAREVFFWEAKQPAPA